MQVAAPAHLQFDIQPTQVLEYDMALETPKDHSSPQVRADCMQVA